MLHLVTAEVEAHCWSCTHQSVAQGLLRGLPPLPHPGVVQGLGCCQPVPRVAGQQALHALPDQPTGSRLASNLLPMTPTPCCWLHARLRCGDMLIRALSSPRFTQPHRVGLGQKTTEPGRQSCTAPGLPVQPSMVDSLLQAPRAAQQGRQGLRLLKVKSRSQGSVIKVLGGPRLLCLDARVRIMELEGMTYRMTSCQHGLGARTGARSQLTIHSPLPAVP